MTTSIIRTSILIALAIAALIGILSTPLDDSATWFADLILAKAFGAGAAYAVYKLYTRWSKTDKWIAAYHDSCCKALDAPNTTYIGKEETER